MTDELPETIRVPVPLLRIPEPPPTTRAAELPDSDDRMLSEHELQDWKNWGG